MTMVSIKAGYCPTHDEAWAGSAGCPACRAAQRRDEVNILEARVADQDAAIEALRRQVNELRHIVLDLQRGYAKLANQVSPDRFLP